MFGDGMKINLLLSYLVIVLSDYKNTFRGISSGHLARDETLQHTYTSMCA